jgi:hypothetical protein
MVTGEEGSADKGKLRQIKKAVYQEKFVSGIRLATKRLAIDCAQAGAMSEPWSRPFDSLRSLRAFDSPRNGLP